MITLFIFCIALTSPEIRSLSSIDVGSFFITLALIEIAVTLQFKSFKN